MTKGKKDGTGDPWTIAMSRYRLSPRQMAMARELGMNPKKFGKMAPNRSEPWKAPLGEFIEKGYRKRFKRLEPFTPPK